MHTHMHTHTNASPDLCIKGLDKEVVGAWCCARVCTHSSVSPRVLTHSTRPSQLLLPACSTNRPNSPPHLFSAQGPSSPFPPCLSVLSAPGESGTGSDQAGVLHSVSKRDASGRENCCCTNAPKAWLRVEGRAAQTPCKRTRGGGPSGCFAR